MYVHIFEPLGYEDVILTPQHFQQYDLWSQFGASRVAGLAGACHWCISDRLVDADALEVGCLQFERLRLRLPDCATLAQLPAHGHLQPEPIFGRLEKMIRDLLDSVIPSRVIVIDLVRHGPSSWAGWFSNERLLAGADYYLSVLATLPAPQLAKCTPKPCKVGSPDDISHIVNAALADIPLQLSPRLSAAIPACLENQYFAHDVSDPAHARMLAARACQIYLPASPPNAELELFAVPTA